MKKLMIAAAIVCAAAVSQAATVAWNTSDKAYAATGWTTLADLTVGTFAADTENGEYMKSIDGITWKYQGTLTKGTETEDFGGDVSWGSNRAKGSFASELFALPSDESTVNYSWEVQMIGTFKKDGKDYTITSDVLKGSGGYTKMSDAKIETGAATSWTVTAAVPEPTSGLLLLLGVAGLALRRRRA